MGTKDGRELIDTISNSKYKVIIVVDPSRKEGTDHYQAGIGDKWEDPFALRNARIGTGANGVVYWDGKDARSLVHELVHAYHGVKGDLADGAEKEVNPNSERDNIPFRVYSKQEFQAVGIGSFERAFLSENGFLEHRGLRRDSYTHIKDEKGRRPNLIPIK